MVADDWNVVNIGEDCTLKARIGWQGLTVEEYRDNGNYFLVTGTDFNNGLVDWDTCHYVDKWRYTQDKNIQLKTGDVLITKDGTIGKVGYVENLILPATLNSGVFVVRPKHDEIFPKYLYYIFTSEIFEAFLSRLTAGSTINHLYQKDFVYFDFYIPHLSEQKAIATALSCVDVLIASLEALIAKKENIKTATMQQLLTGKKRLDGFSGEWEEKKLGDIVTVIGGGTPSTTISNYWNGHIDWYTPTEVGKDKYISKSIRTLTDEGFQNSSTTILPIGTILFTSRAGIGDMSILMTEGCTNQGFQSFVVKKDIDNEFIYYLTSTLTSKFLQNASGSTFLEISPNQVKQINVLVPKYKEQIAIATILSDMDKELEALNTRLEKTKAIKVGMMQELLTGKTRLI